jgi:hypothetical protein
MVRRLVTVSSTPRASAGQLGPSNAGSGTAILLDDEGDAPEQIRHHHISWQLVLRWDLGGRVKSVGGLRDA